MHLYSCLRKYFTYLLYFLFALLRACPLFFSLGEVDGLGSDFLSFWWPPPSVRNIRDAEGRSAR